MPTKLSLLVGVLSLSTLCLSAGNPLAPQEKNTPPTGNRYLLIVENSASMERRDEGLRQTIFDALNTGLRGRMETGDTFGVWTFNTTVDNRFPMQIWDSAMRLDLGTRVNTFLRNQGYHKRGKLDAAMIDLAAVIESVGDLTVVFFTDGNDHMQGTPFDKEINALYRQLSTWVVKQKLPVLTGLTIRSGQYVAYSVVAAGDPLALPPPTGSPRRRQSPASKSPRAAFADAGSPAPRATNTPTHRAAPIIMSKDGKDPEADSDQPATPVIGTQVSKAPTPPVTDTAHGTSTRTPAPPPVRLPVQETETRSQPSAQTSTTTAVAPGGDVRSRINTTTAITPTTSAVSVQGSTVPTTSATPPQATSSPTPKTSAATAPIPTLHGTGFTLEQLTQSIAHAVETPAQNLAARSASVRSRASTTTTSTEPTPPELESGQTLGASPMLNFPTHPMSVHAREKGGQDPIIATYPTVPRESGPSRSNTLLGAAVLMCAGSLVGIWASWMRVRRQSQGSYISRAMPRAGDDRTSQRQRTRSGSNP